MVTLTNDEADCLKNHLQYYIIQEVKDDPDYDGIEYLQTLVHIFEKCGATESVKNLHELEEET